jgi:hypothetical protein
MKFEIKSRWNASVLFSLETENMKLCVEAAVKSRANLRDANLGGANLRGADLRGADLRGADLRGAKLTANDRTELLLIGHRAVLQMGPLGSRADYLIAYLTDKGVYIKAGCFFDTLAAFTKAVKETHGTNDHGKEYAAVIAAIKVHAKLWTPKAEKAKKSA